MNNNHTLAIGKKYWMIGDQYRYVYSDTFSIGFECDNRTEDYPHAFNDKCYNYDWCGNNYRKNFFGNRCSAFNACIMTGDGDFSYDPRQYPCWLVEIWEDFDQTYQKLLFQLPEN